MTNVRQSARSPEDMAVGGFKGAGGEEVGASIPTHIVGGATKVVSEATDGSESERLRIYLLKTISEEG